MSSGFDREFDAFLTPLLASKSVEQRLAEIDRLYGLWEREHAVPVNGELVWIGGQSRRQGTSTPRSMTPPRSRKRWLGLIPIALAIGFFLWGGKGSSGVANSNTVVAVSAEQNGINAPATMVIENHVFRVVAFDPADNGWPDPSTIDENTVMWGGTAINQVFGINGDVFADLDEDSVFAIGQILTIQRLDSVSQTYRISERHIVHAADVSFAQQRDAGVTLVAWGNGNQRTVLRAVPSDVPQTAVTIDDGTISVANVAWSIGADLKQTLIVSLVVSPISQEGTVMYQERPLLELPTAETQRIALAIVPPTDSSSVVVPFVINTTTIQLDIPVPSPPVLNVRWDGVYQHPNGFAVVTHLDSAAVVVNSTDVGCLVSNQLHQMTVSVPLPLIITNEQTITWLCATDLPRGALADVWIGDQRITVTLP